MSIARRQLAFLLVAAAAMAVAVVGDSAVGASSTVVVTATVPSAITMTNTCRQRAAWDLGTVLPGANALTDTAANVCHIAFQSSNDTSMLRVVQSDRTGTAMTSGATSWTGSGAINPDGPTMGVAASSTTEALANISWASNSFGKSTDGGATFPASVDAAGGSTDYGSVSNPVAGVMFRFGHSRARLSTNGGTTWADLPTRPWTTGIDAEAVDATHIWVVADGNTTYVTADGGATWTTATIGCANPAHIAGESATVGYVIAPGFGRGICVSSDAGVSWTQKQAAAGVSSTEFWRDVDAPAGTPGTAWAVGSSGAIIKTTDTGDNWVTQTTPTTANLYGVFARTTLDVWAVGEQGTILHTVNGGTSWNEVSIPTTEGLRSVTAPSSNQVYVGGLSSLLMRSNDTGSTWSTPIADGETGWLGIDALSRDTEIVAGGGGRIETTTDSGTTWVPETTPSATVNLHDVTWQGDTDPVAVGDGGVIWLSSDSGATFTARPDPTSTRLRAVDAWNDDLTVAVGDGGVAQTSTDGGRNWTTRTSNTTSPLWSVSVLDSTRAMAVGDGGVLIRTTDSGATWTKTTPFPGENMRSVSMASATVAYATANTHAVNSAYLWKTTDGGATWTKLTSVDAGGVVAAANDDVVYVAVNVGTWATQPMYVSRDGGATWSAYDAGFAAAFDIVAVDGSVALAAGDSGYIRRTDAATSIADYGGVNTWASTNTFFGGCLQALGGSAVAGSWTPKGSACTDVDTGGYWNAVPSAPVKVAKVATAGLAGSADFVWGLHTATNTSPGKLGAGVTFEALAPDV